MKSTASLIVALLTMALWSSASLASNYKLDGSHTEVGFSVKHLVISNVKGRFGKFDGGFTYDAATKALSNVDVKIEVSSVDTNDKKRDEHLTSPDFFDAAKFATMEFKADKVANVVAGKTVKVPGSLTIHGVTKPVTLTVDFAGTVTDPYGKERVVFAATTKVNRNDFGVKWNKTMDKGGVVVGEEVTINIEAESVKAD